MQTVKEWLTGLARSNSSSDSDSRKLSNLLRNTLDYKNVVVVAGIVYLDGQGTIENPPQSIHAIARMICKALKISLAQENFRTK